MTAPPCLESLNDHTLLSQFGDLVCQDREGKASLIRHIDAIDRRKLWAKPGHSSLFGFLVVRYHMSESTAAKRIGAARTARRFPVLFGMVARGEIHLSGIHRLTAHLTPENHVQVLGEAQHKTIRRCTFVGADGHRCNETRGLEFAHVEPWAKGGPTTVENLALRCIAHNAWEAERDYGTDFMASGSARRAASATDGRSHHRWSVVGASRPASPGVHAMSAASDTGLGMEFTVAMGPPRRRCRHKS